MCSVNFTLSSASNEVNFPCLYIISIVFSQLNQRYPMGSVIKTMMYYNHPFWRDDGKNRVWNSKQIDEWIQIYFCFIIILYNDIRPVH